VRVFSGVKAVPHATDFVEGKRGKKAGEKNRKRIA